MSIRKEKVCFRYDHFGALCELLPAAIPSLALCLSILRHSMHQFPVYSLSQPLMNSCLDGFTEEAHKEASEAVGSGNILMPITQKSRLAPVVPAFYNVVTVLFRPQPLIESCSFPGSSISIGSQWQANLFALFQRLLNSEL